MYYLKTLATPIFWNNYLDIVLGFILGFIAFVFHLSDMPYFATTFAALTIGAISITVAEIAEILAERLEEPYASFVLTFSAVAVEIILLFMIILESTHAPEALETVKGGIISAVIVDMNVLLGIAVFIGGLSYSEQEHNEDTSSTYTTILLVATSALLVPSIINFGNNGENDLFTASVMIAIVLIIFYVAIFIFQTRTHQHFFKTSAKSRLFQLKKHKDEYEEEEDGYLFDRLNNLSNLIIIFVLIFFIGVFAEIFAQDGMIVAKDLGISTGLAGLIIAIIAVSPEILTAIKAAQNDQMQRVVNIAMGASTVSILLTVPLLMALSYMNGIYLTLDFNAFQIGALILTIILAWKTTDDGETNYFEGVSHIMFFASYAIIATMYH
ncbi:Calcium/proton antiporter [hydrothermal vent metagenome]|uniref:Calcium/proton antiporter n=1 Tax=hydrothermal vent metagenome TaxID=652676 RepID=A0A1W1CBS9_9ZZZZ